MLGKETKERKKQREREIEKEGTDHDSVGAADFITSFFLPD